MSLADTVVPPEVAVRIERRQLATRFRIDHQDDPQRESVWVMYRAGALWRKPKADTRAIVLGLNDAARAVPWPDFDPAP